jgi:hypothetical protein
MSDPGTDVLAAPNSLAATMKHEIRSGGSVVLMASTDEQNGDPHVLYADLMAPLLASGRTIACSRGETQAIERLQTLPQLASVKTMSPFQLLVSIAEGRQKALQATLAKMAADPSLWWPAPPTLAEWNALPPAKRRLLPGQAPPDLLAPLQDFMGFVVVPAAWTGIDGVVCTRVSGGWNDNCTVLRAVMAGNLLPIQGKYDPGQPVELVLCESDRDPFGSVVASLGTFHVAPPIGNGLTPLGTITSSATSLSGIVAEARHQTLLHPVR